MSETNPTSVPTSTATPDTKPMVPKVLMWVAVVLGAGAVTVSEFIPPPFSLIALIGGYLALFLGGVAGPSPFGTKPVLPLVAVPIVGMVGAMLTQYAMTLPPENKWHGVLLATSGLCAWLAGKGTPSPRLAAVVAAAETEKQADAVADATVKSREDALKAIDPGPKP